MTDISGNNYNTRRQNFTDVSNNIQNSLFTIVNEMLNGIEDGDSLDTRDFNPFLYRRRRNYTVGRNIDPSSPLFNIINQIFDTSSNIQMDRYNNTTNSENQTNNENQNENNDETQETIVEQITFQVTYPLSLDIPPIPSTRMTNNIQTNPQSQINSTNNNSQPNNNINSNLNDLGNTINSMINSSISTAFSTTNIGNDISMFDYYRNSRPIASTIRSYYSPISSSYNSFDNIGGIFQQILSQSLYDESAYKKKISEKGKLELMHIKFDKNDKDNLNTSCPIMQTEFEDEQYVIKLPCNHLFLPDAINRWLEEKPECPVCRHELDYIEVKRELNNFNSNNNQNQERNIIRSNIIQNDNTFTQSSVLSPPDNPRYNNYYRQNRQMGRDRIQLTQNSYLDYLYEEIDNSDFQRALILSYRELVDSSDNEINSIQYNVENSEIINNVYGTMNEDGDSDTNSEISESTQISNISEDESDDSQTSYYADDDY